MEHHTATGAELDKLAGRFGLQRQPGETDEALRRRGLALAANLEPLMPPTFPNYREALRAAFGPSADGIPGVDPQAGTLTDIPVYALRVLLNEDAPHAGRTFVYCGDGEVFAVMPAAGPATTLRFYLVREDGDGREWDRLAERIRNRKAGEPWDAEEGKRFHAGRPSARYKVVASA